MNVLFIYFLVEWGQLGLLTGEVWAARGGAEGSITANTNTVDTVATPNICQIMPYTLFMT